MVTTTDDSLAYYREPAPMSAINEASHGWALEGLGREPASLARAVRSGLIHRDWAPLLGLRFGPDRLVDQHIRPVDEILARIGQLGPEPLSADRAAEDRMVGVCRHFAVLHAALLRQGGVPARARVGFARYFGNGWSDHWITERWDGRWVRDDPQVGTIARRALALDFDPSDQPSGQFLTGAEAWIRCRAGDADPQDFGIFDEHGLWFVLGNLRLDLAAINKVELLPWDSWGATGGPDWDPTPDELHAIDELACVVARDDLNEIRQRYRDLRVPQRVISFIDGVLTPVDLGELANVTSSE